MAPVCPIPWTPRNILAGAVCEEDGAVRVAAKELVSLRGRVSVAR